MLKRHNPATVVEAFGGGLQPGAGDSAGAPGLLFTAGQVGAWRPRRHDGGRLRRPGRSDLGPTSWRCSTRAAWAWTTSSRSPATSWATRTSRPMRRGAEEGAGRLCARHRRRSSCRRWRCPSGWSRSRAVAAKNRLSGAYRTRAPRAARRRGIMVTPSMQLKSARRWPRVASVSVDDALDLAGGRGRALRRRARAGGAERRPRSPAPWPRRAASWSSSPTPPRRMHNPGALVRASG